MSKFVLFAQSNVRLKRNKFEATKERENIKGNI